MTKPLSAARNSMIGNIGVDSVLEMAGAVAHRCARSHRADTGGVHVAMTDTGDVYAPLLASPLSLAAVSRPEWHVGTYEAPISPDDVADDLRCRALELGIAA